MARIYDFFNLINVLIHDFFIRTGERGCYTEKKFVSEKFKRT